MSEEFVKNFESLPLSDRARINLSETNALIRDGIGHPEYPSWLRERIAGFEGSIELVDDRVFFDEVVSFNSRLLHPQLLGSNALEEKTRTVTSAGDVIYLTDVNTLLVKEAYAGSLAAGLWLFDLIAEKLFQGRTGSKASVEISEADRYPYSTYGYQQALDYLHELSLVDPGIEVFFSLHGFRTIIDTPEGVIGDLPFAESMESIRGKLLRIHLQCHATARIFGAGFPVGLAIEAASLKSLGLEDEHALLMYGEALGWEDAVSGAVERSLDDFIDLGNDILGPEINEDIIERILNLESQADEEEEKVNRMLTQQLESQLPPDSSIRNN